SAAGPAPVRPRGASPSTAGGGDPAGAAGRRSSGPTWANRRGAPTGAPGASPPPRREDRLGATWTPRGRGRYPGRQLVSKGPQVTDSSVHGESAAGSVPGR